MSWYKIAQSFQSGQKVRFLNPLTGKEENGILFMVLKSKTLG